jgi:signal transduction histidine kinase/CheY-like chemotaxis protein
MDLPVFALETLSRMPGTRIALFDASGACVAVFGEDSARSPWPKGPIEEALRRLVQESDAPTPDARELLGRIVAARRPLALQSSLATAEGRVQLVVDLWPLEREPLVACQVRHASREDAIEMLLRTGDSRYRATIMESAPFTLEIDEHGILLSVGPRLEELWSAPLGSPLAEHLTLEAVHPDDRAAALARLEQFIARREPVGPYRTRARDLQGRWREFEASGVWYRHPEGPHGLLVVREVRDSGAGREQAVARLCDATFDILLDLDATGRIIADPHAPIDWRRGAAHLIGSPAAAFVHPDDVPQFEGWLSQNHGDAPIAPTRLRWRSSPSAWRSLDTQAVPYHLANGDARVLVAAREPAEGAARDLVAGESGALEWMPRANFALLAGGVAHDLNNVLTLSMGLSDVLARQLAESSPARAYAREIAQASRLAAQLSRQLLTVTGQRPARRAVLDLNAVIESVRELLGASLPRSVHFELDLCSAPLWVEGDATQLRRLLLNVVTNAGEAIGARPGSVRVSTTEGVAGEADGGGPLAVLEVRDDGRGVAAADRERIFQPLYTTKGNGHGLGLAVVQSILRAHGGRAAVAPAPGGGTCFRVELPRVPEPSSDAVGGASETRSFPPGTSVLVVSGDPGVQRLTAAILEGANLRVLQTGDATSARARIAAEADLACVVLDADLARGEARSLLADVRALRPDLRIVLCADPLQAPDLSDPGVRVIDKPYRYADLIAAVWSSLRA